MTKNTPAPQPTIYSARFRLWFWLTSFVLFCGFIWLLRGILLPFVVGMMAAYFLDPLVNRLRKRGYSRTFSAAIITFGFFAIVITLGVVLAPALIHQLSALITELPDYLQTLRDTITDTVQDYATRLSPDQAGAIKKAAGNVSSTLVGYVSGFISGVLRSGLAFLNLASLIFLTPVVAFYLLRDWPKVLQRLSDILPRAHVPVIRQQLAIIDRTLSGFIRGQTNVCLILACYYSVFLTLARLKFSLGLGIMTGVLLFVPFIGIATSFSLSMIVALFQFGATIHLGVIAAVYGVGIILESGLITPRLVGDKVGLHPLWIIFGMLSGATLFGLVGVLIAVPVTSVLGVLVRFAIRRYLESPLYRDA